MKYVKVFTDANVKYQKLNDAEFGRLIRAALIYKENGEEVSLTGREALFWDDMKLGVDNDTHLTEVRMLAGQKGGLAKASKSSKAKQNLANLANPSKKESTPLCPPLKEIKENISPITPLKEKKENIPPYNPPKENITRVARDDSPTANAVGSPSSVDDAFEKFWTVYPKKVGKGAARKAFGKVKVNVDVLISAVKKQKESVQWKRDNGQFIPNPETWLNQGRWDDELETRRFVYDDSQVDDGKWDLMYGVTL